MQKDSLSHRIVEASLISSRILDAYRELGFNIDSELLNLIRAARDKESSALAIDILNDIELNANLAKTEFLPPCQDTGSQVFLVELGREVLISGDSLENAINKAVEEATNRYYLRPSIVRDPLFDRCNTRNNCPVVFHVKLCEGSELTIHIAQKGGGAENMSKVFMLPPSTWVDDIIHIVCESVKEAGSNACPPIVLGIGIGGNFEQVAFLAKRALFRPLGSPNPIPDYSILEKRILNAVNELQIGAQGMGGNTTALAVHIETAPCHIASLPLAINFQCHSHRHISIRI